MRSTENLDPIRRAVAEVLEQEPFAAAAYVYGSMARGASTPLSDLDVAVVLGPGVRSHERGELVRRLIAALEQRLDRRRVEVRLLDELPAAVRGRIVTEGVRVFDRDRARRVEAEVRARMDYHDFLPFELAGTREGLRALRERAGRG